MAPSQFYGSNCCIENDPSWHLTNKVHTWFTYYLIIIISLIFNLMTDQKAEVVNEFRDNKNIFFDNFTIFRFHPSPSLLASLLFTKLSILEDKTNFCRNEKKMSNWRDLYSTRENEICHKNCRATTANLSKARANPFWTGCFL